jgi:hypothetical protein
MKLLFEDDLVEAAVQLCARGARPGVPALQVRRFHAERERCYAVLDPDERVAAFARVHLEWFREWGLAWLLECCLEPFRGLKPALATLAFRLARGRTDEGAELYRNAEGQSQGIIALHPDRLREDDLLRGFLHHELAHLADMVAPGFGYTPDLAGAGQTAAQQRLIRERYRLLWNVSVDGRLHQRGLATVCDAAQRQRELERGFAFLPAARRTELLAGLWTGTLATHAELLEIAADPRDFREVHAPVPGAHCPLCGFAAFQWADLRALPSAALARIRSEFPAWREDEVPCARCAEIYQSITGLEYPATVCL